MNAQEYIYKNRSKVEAAIAAEINSQAWEEGCFQGYTGDGELVTVETLEWAFMGCGVTAYDEGLLRPVIRELAEKIWGENAERPVLDDSESEDEDEDTLTAEECATNLLDLGEKIYSPKCIACAANISYEEARHYYSQYYSYEFIEEVKNALCPPDDHPAIAQAASELLDLALEEHSAEDVLDELGIEYDDDDEEEEAE